MKVFASFLRDIWNEDHTPLSWGESLVVLLFKKSTHSDQQPALMPVCSRTYPKIIRHEQIFRRHSPHESQSEISPRSTFKPSVQDPGKHSENTEVLKRSRALVDGEMEECGKGCCYR